MQRNILTVEISQLESVKEMYFKKREIKEEDKEDDYLDSKSSSDDEGAADQDDPGDDAVELTEIYKIEHAKVQAFYCKICKCKMGRRDMRSSGTLSLDDVTEYRNNCNKLSSTELDLAILGIINSSLNCNEISISGRVENKKPKHKNVFLLPQKKNLQENLSISALTSILLVSQPH